MAYFNINIPKNIINNVKYYIVCNSSWAKTNKSFEEMVNEGFILVDNTHTNHYRFKMDLSLYKYIQIVLNDTQFFENTGLNYQYLYNDANCTNQNKNYNISYAKVDTTYKFNSIQLNGSTINTSNLLFVRDNTFITYKEVTTYTITQNLTNCISNYSETTAEENTEINITLTANNGCLFDVIPTSNIGTFTISEDKKTATLTTTLTSDLVISGNANKYYTITQNLTNCISNYSETTVEENAKINVTLTANNGCLFFTPPTSNIGTFTISEDKKIATLTTTLTSDLVISGNASEFVNGSYDLTNCTCNKSDVIFNKNTEIYLSVRCDNDFYNIPYILMNDVKLEMEQIIASSKKAYQIIFTPTHDFIVCADGTQFVKYTITNNLSGCKCLTDIKTGYELNESVTLVYEVEKTHHKFNDNSISYTGLENVVITYNTNYTQATLNGNITNNATISVNVQTLPHITITGTLINCVCNYQNGEILEDDKPIIITALEGYVFTGNYTYLEDNYLIMSLANHNNYLIINDTSCSITLNDYYNASEIVESESNFISIFVVDNNILNDLSKVTFYDYDGENTSKVDYSKFITELYKLPFNSDNIKSNSVSNIVLGNYDTNIVAPKSKKTVLNIDIGNITVNEKYHNSFDYQDVTCTLHAPFIKSIELPCEYVISQTLTIKYNIDLYSGDTTIYIISSLTNSIIYSENQKIKKDLPFIQRQNNTVVNTITSYIDNGIRCAYIEVLRNIPIINNDVHGKTTQEYDILHNYSGYIEIDNIDLKVKATNKEKDEILNILKTGVYINDKNS